MTHDEFVVAIARLYEDTYANGLSCQYYKNTRDQLIALVELFEIEVLSVIPGMEIIVKGKRHAKEAIQWRHRYGNGGAFITTGTIEGVPTEPGCFDGGYDYVVCI